MQAYTINNEFDYLSIVYVEDAAELDNYDDPKRAEWADAYAPHDPPARAWMDNGYTFGCAHCEHQLSMSEGYCDRCAGEEDEDDAKKGNDSILFIGDDVFCGMACWKASVSEREKRLINRIACRESFTKKFPFATVTHEWNGGVGQCDCFKKDWFNTCLHWTVPGATTGDHANSYCGGCGRAWVCNGDREAFEAAKNSARSSDNA